MTSRREFLLHSTAVSLAMSSSLTGAHSMRNVTAPAGREAKVCKAATSATTRIKSAIRREDTVRRYGGDGDNWHMSWASDDRQYVSVCDGTGFTDPPSENYNSRLFGIRGGPENARFEDVPGYPKLTFPSRGIATQSSTDPRYYNFGTLALDGYLYQFMSTFKRSFRPEDLEKSDPRDMHRFIGAKLIYSPDNGRTWHNQNGSTPVAWEAWNRRSRDTLVFFQEDQDAFSVLSVLQMGKNYELNQDGYVYVYAPNGSTEGTMNELVMFRVPKSQLLQRERYEYFAGRGPREGARWTSELTARAVVHTFPSGWVNKIVHPWAWVPSVTYNASLGLYMMASWGSGVGSKGEWFAKPSYLGFWVADNPWGPWHQVHEETAWMPTNDHQACAFAPQIAPKWIAPNGQSFWVVWSDYQERKAPLGAESTKTTADENEMDARVQWRREHPHYEFNVQRVDLIVA